MTRTPPGTLPEPAVPEPAVPERSARVASIVGATRAILVEQGWEAVSMRMTAAGGVGKAASKTWAVRSPVASTIVAR